MTYGDDCGDEHAEGLDGLLVGGGRLELGQELAPHARVRDVVLVLHDLVAHADGKRRMDALLRPAGTIIAEEKTERPIFPPQALSLFLYDLLAI
jgi:hypothetical protein